MLVIILAQLLMIFVDSQTFPPFQSLPPPYLADGKEKGYSITQR